MAVVTTLVQGAESRGVPFVRADLARMPDDGRRYELVDGCLIVTPAPSVRHQYVSSQVFNLLRSSAPDDVLVLYAPVDVAFDETTVLQPDVVVARTADFTEADLPVAPLLAVEILSPSTRRIDLTVKKARYEAAGAPSYWVVDPGGPSITAWHLVDGRYAEPAHAAGDDLLTVDQPFRVTVRPSDLLPPKPRP